MIDASRMPSASACSRSAANRAAASLGMIRPPPARWSRYSRITRESNRVVPSSSRSVGILPSGFCRRTVSAGLAVSAGSIAIAPSRPNTLAPILILRPNGELGEVRNVNMEQATIGDSRGRSGDARAGGLFAELSRRTSAGDDEVDGLRAFALLVGLDVEGDALPLGQRLEAGALDGGDVHEHVASAVVRLDEAVAALGVEELDRTCHGHRETPFPVVAPPPAPTARRLGRTFANGERERPHGLRSSAGPHRRRNVKASADENTPNQGCGKVAKALFAGEPVDALRAAARTAASSGSSAASSPASVHGGLITISPQARSRSGASGDGPASLRDRGAATRNSARRIFAMPLARRRRAS